MNTTVARYILGVAALLIVCGGVAAAAVALRRRWFAYWSGALARLAETLIGVAVLIVILELLGTVGLFRLAPITVACALVGAGVWLAVSPGRRAVPGRRALSPAAIGLGVLALPAVAAVYAEWASPTLQAYDVGVHVVDSIWYHLPWAAAIAQTGHLTPLRFTDVEFLTTFYPATGEMLHALGIVLLGRDTISPAFNLLWLGLALLAAGCIGVWPGPSGGRPGPFGGQPGPSGGRPGPSGGQPGPSGGRTRSATAICAVALVMATPMMNFSQPGSADNDVIGVFFFLSAAALLLNGDGRRECYVLAALAAGLTISVKLTFLVPVAILTIGVIVIAPLGRRVSSAAWWIGPVVLAGGFWYVRDLIAVGNPLPFTSFGILPTPAAPLQQHTGYAIAHYLTDSRIWSQFAEPAFASGLGRWWVVIVALAVAGPLLCLLPGSNAVLRMLALVAVASLGAYLFTPESAMGPAGDPVGIAYNVRYAAPALALSFALLPLAPLLDGLRRQLAVCLGLLVVLAATIWQPGLWPVRHNSGAVVVGVFVLVAGLLVIALRARRSLSRGLRIATLACAALLLLAGAAAGYAWQRHYLRGRYEFRPKVSYLAPVWAFFRAVHDTRVGLVGTYGGYFGYPLYGIDDSNRVQYIAHRGPHGSFTPIATCAQWREAVNAAHVRYLVTTPKREFWQAKRLFPSPETGWTASDPAAKVVYRRLALRQPITIFELRGALDPAGC